MLMKNVGKIIILASGIILLLSTDGFTSGCGVTWGSHSVILSCFDENARRRGEIAITCTLCHSYKTQTEVQASLMQYNYQSMLKHHLDYFPKNVLVVEEGKQYPLDAQKYITREKGFIVLVDGTEKYKYIFQPYTIVLRNNQGRAIAIESLCDFQKVPLAPVSTQSPPVQMPIQRR